MTDKKRAKQWRALDILNGMFIRHLTGQQPMDERRFRRVRHAIAFLQELLSAGLWERVRDLENEQFDNPQ
jgi:hypothetical protein